MKKLQTMSEKEVLQWLEDNPCEDVKDLLNERMPTVADAFYRLDKQIGNLLKRVRRVFPDAEFYTTGGDGFALLLGKSHSDEDESAQHQLSALVGFYAEIGGGDW
jgi:hypothetical protein